MYHLQGVLGWVKYLISIYTDGGCSGNPGPGGWAYVIVRSGEGEVGNSSLLGELWGAERLTTNNRMELQAVIAALEALPSYTGHDKRTGVAACAEKITVYTDWQYVQKGMTVWLEAWKGKGWKTSNRQPVKNKDLWQRLEALAAGFTIDWAWVKGHAGDKYNERCDMLTQKAIASLR